MLGTTVDCGVCALVGRGAVATAPTMASPSVTPSTEATPCLPTSMSVTRVPSDCMNVTKASMEGFLALKIGFEPALHTTPAKANSPALRSGSVPESLAAIIGSADEQILDHLTERLATAATLEEATGGLET
jgi:hypothetical protein